MAAHSRPMPGSPVLIRSKVDLPDIDVPSVPRPRLAELFDGAHRIIAVTAMSGYGATTAVAHWARASAFLIRHGQLDAAHIAIATMADTPARALVSAAAALAEG